MTDRPAVELTGVTKSFGKMAQKAVDGISLHVPQSSIYGFIGPNGSGKTTTLRMIMRIYRPDEGEVRVLGESGHGPADDRVGYLPEERSTYKQMSVRETVSFYSQLKGHTPKKPEVDAWLERLDLLEHHKKKVQDLSKGMTQKLQLICVAISKPQLVLLDEPFSGLDPVNAEVLRKMILDMRRDGTTVIFSTHDMSTAEEMCDRVFMIYRGKKVLDGTLDEIKHEYGQDIIRVESDFTDFTRLPGVEGVNERGNLVELRTEKDVDTQALLRELISRGRVTRFEVAAPTLHDIFVRIARPEPEHLVTESALGGRFEVSTA